MKETFIERWLEAAETWAPESAKPQLREVAYRMKKSAEMLRQPCRGSGMCAYPHAVCSYCRLADELETRPGTNG